MILEFFPPVVQALNLEVSKHPVLLEVLRQQGRMDLETTVGHVAAYCDVILDDYYMEEDLEALFNLLLDRLRKKSMSVLN